MKLAISWIRSSRSALSTLNRHWNNGAILQHCNHHSLSESLILLHRLNRASDKILNDLIICRDNGGNTSVGLALKRSHPFVVESLLSLWTGSRQELKFMQCGGKTLIVPVELLKQ